MEQMMLIDSGPTLMEMTLSDSILLLDPRIQQRVDLDAATVAAYRDLYADGRDLGRLTLFYDGAVYLVADGFHRCEAARQAGKTTLPAEVRPGGYREAVLYATSCNLHGKVLTNADKRKRVRTLLQDPEWRLWADNHIARHCGVSHTFVSRLRDALATVASEEGESETSQPTTIRKFVNKHGQQVTMQVDAIGHRDGHATCADGGRSLTDAASISGEIGPVCACKQQSSRVVTAHADAPVMLEERPATAVPSMPHVDTEDAQGNWALRLIDILNRLAPLVGQPMIHPWPPQSPDLHLETVRALVDACIARLTPPTPVEAPTALATGRPPGYGVLAAKVREALAASPGSTCAALAKAIGAKPKHVDKALKRLISQGKARKEGRTYVLQKGQA